MAINTITYANKSAIYTNTSIPDANKVNDTDMNEIKTVVNTNANLMGDLSTLTTTTQSSIVGAINEVNTPLSITTDGSAVKTDRKIDNHDEYVKRITLDNLPGNNTTKTWPSGITMTNLIMTSMTICVKTGAGNWFTLPNNDTVNCRTQLSSNGDISISMFTGNLSGTTGYAEIKYFYTS